MNNSQFQWDRDSAVLISKKYTNDWERSLLLYNYADRKNLIQCNKLHDIHDGMTKIADTHGGRSNCKIYWHARNCKIYITIWSTTKYTWRYYQTTRLYDQTARYTWYYDQLQDIYSSMINWIKIYMTVSSTTSWKWRYDYLQDIHDGMIKLQDTHKGMINLEWNNSALKKQNRSIFLTTSNSSNSSLNKSFQQR